MPKTCVACVGRDAYAHRITGDLHVDHRDRRLIICRDHHDIDRVRGLRGADVVWVNMGASPYQQEIVRERELREITVEEARALLHG